MIGFWQFAIRWCIWLCINILLLYGAYQLCTSWARFRNAELGTAIGIVIVACLVGVQVLCGAMGRLDFVPISTSLFVLAILMIIWAHRKCAKNREDKSSMVDIALVVWKPSRVLWLFLVTATVAHLSARTVIALIEPPCNWDSVRYHLPTVMQWLKSKSLWITSQPPYWSHPRNAELLLAWLLMPFRSDLLANLYNFPILIWFCFPVWLLAKQVEISRQWRWFLVFTLPHMGAIGSGMLGTQKNDLLLVALFMSGLAFLFCLGDSNGNNEVRALLSALTVGLLIGTKLNGIFYSFFILLLLLFLGQKKSSAVLLRYIAYICCGLVLGLFWFIKNWLLIGKPFLIDEPYSLPKDISQVMPSTLLWSIRSIEVIRSFLTDVIMDAGWWSVFGLISAVVLFIVPLVQISETVKFRIRSLALLTVACFFAFLCSPKTNFVAAGHGMVRIGFPYVVLSLICVFFLISQLSKAWSTRKQFLLQLILSPFVLVPSGIPQEIFHRLFVSPRGMAGVILFCVGVYILFVIPQRRALVAKLALGLGALTLLLSPIALWKLQCFRLDRWADANAYKWNINGQQSSIFKWIQTTSQLKIVLYGTEIHYPFYGPRWQNELCFDNRAIVTDEYDWVRFLCQKGVNRVVFYKFFQNPVMHRNPVWPKQREWLLLSDPTLFQLRYQDSIAEAWELRDVSCSKLGYDSR